MLARIVNVEKMVGQLVGAVEIIAVIYFWCVTPSLMLFDSCKRLFYFFQSCPPPPAFFVNLLRNSFSYVI